MNTYKHVISKKMVCFSPLITNIPVTNNFYWKHESFEN